MHEIKEKSLHIKGIDIAYTVIGPQDGRILFCVHGLLSNSRDYDFLAAFLANKHGCRVISVDLPGRGRSEYFKNCKHYKSRKYIPYILAVIAQEIGSAPFDWLGVSLGGMLGMALHKHRSLNIKRFILNDIGAEVPAIALDHVAQFAKVPAVFENRDDAVIFLKKRCASWGIVEEHIWDHLIAHNIHESDSGCFVMHYDDGIGRAMRDKNRKVALWWIWRRIKQPVFLIRGAKSGVLPVDIAQKMARTYRGERFDEVVYEDCGHVPSLMQDEQIKAIADWLEKE